MKNKEPIAVFMFPLLVGVAAAFAQAVLFLLALIVLNASKKGATP